MSLRRSPVVDSGELAALRRRELEITHERARSLGVSALAAIREGRYVADDGHQVDWKADVEKAAASKVSLRPDAPLPAPPRARFPETQVVVANETTLGAARRLHDAGFRPLSLNFANGVVPGGGVLTGARAQEEVLCRSSALLCTLDGDPMYDAHRQGPPYESSDWLILSPDVPVFRRDDGLSLAQPWSTSFVTCAAPYAPRVGQPRSGELLERRMRRLLAVAHAYAFDTLVLGAWGCGAFGNDPARTARDFRAALEGDLDGAFRQVTFAITDWSAERRFLGPFRDAFSLGT
jgi:uncharacterized protein (TIGR02452 family)